MQTVRKHIKLSHILFFPFGLWRWADWTEDNNPGDLTARPPACLPLPLRFTIMRGKLWVTARTSRDDRNYLDDELNYYDLSHSQNICPLSLSMCSLAEQNKLCQPFDVFMIIILINSPLLSPPELSHLILLINKNWLHRGEPSPARVPVSSSERETERSRRHKHQSGV